MAENFDMKCENKENKILEEREKIRFEINWEEMDKQ